MKRRDHIGTYLSVAILALTLMSGLVGSVGAQATINVVRKSEVRPDSDLGNGDAAQSEMRSVIERYTADRGSLARFFTVEASPTRRTRMKQFYTEWLGSLAKLNFDAMSQDGKIDYVLFKNHLDHELRQLDIQEKAFAEVAALTPFASTITDLEDFRRSMKAIDSPKTAALLTRLSKQIDAT